MINMGVGQEQIDILHSVARDHLTQVAQPGSGIENEKLLAAADFDTRRIAAVSRGSRPGTRYRTPHSPETDEKVAISRHVTQSQ